MNKKFANFRFYEELNDFLAKDRRKVSFKYCFTGDPSVKDVIEMIGVPHGEIDLILVNGQPVGFDYRLADQDNVSVYPMFEAIDISSVSHYLRPKPLRVIQFILDVHLGKLTKYLRICGFDCLFENLPDSEIVELSLQEKRIILTKDRGLLKNKRVTHSYWIRSDDPLEQLLEVFNRFDLKNKIEFLVRCLVCNSRLQEIAKEEVKDKVPSNTLLYYDKFLLCPHCKKIYWEGSHFQNMTRLLEFIKQDS
jgi:uncharacterized protein with PIN domain